ncbi:MAG: hypothetical protein LBR48_02400 [Dysgonamonadaceae bacterium]|nr:hypothetical protein [Dysgonamonadaceae bacterium]
MRGESLVIIANIHNCNLSFNAEYPIVMGYYFILKFKTATVVGINKSPTEKTVIGLVKNVVTCLCYRFSGLVGDILRFDLTASITGKGWQATRSFSSDRISIPYFPLLFFVIFRLVLPIRIEYWSRG